MKVFIVKTMIFLSILLIVLIAMNLLLSNYIVEGNYFSIENNTYYIALGDSQIESSLNDSLIDNFSNFAASGDSYLYTFLKLKKILENNKHIKTVFIGFSNHQIHKGISDMRLWQDSYLLWKYPKYGVLMNFSDKWLLGSRNLNALFLAQNIAFLKNIGFIFSKRNNYMSYMKWGGYHALLGEYANDTLSGEHANSGDSIDETKDYQIPIKSINYLVKAIELCNKFGVKVCLIRTPLYDNWQDLYNNEPIFRRILSEKFKGVEFIDYKNLPLQKNEFYDNRHLNSKGAATFSNLFNNYIKTTVTNMY